MTACLQNEKPDTSKKEIKPMPKRILPLSEVQVRNAKPQAKEYKLMDGFGLYLLVTPTNGKLWRHDYRHGGKRKGLSFGAYPAVTLADARKYREEAKRLIASGTDPAEHKKEKKAAVEQAALYTFEVVTRKWYDTCKARWSDGHAKHILSRFENDIFPTIGSIPIADIRRKDLISPIEIVSKRSLETAHRIKTAINQMLNYAVNNELIQFNPLGSTKGLLPKIEHKHMAAPTDPKDVAPLLRAIDEFNGSFIVKAAMQLSPLLFCRPEELRHMEWTEVDLDRGEWSIPAEKMKQRLAHLVPLSTQAITILNILHQVTGRGKYAFPCQRSPMRCMSDAAVNAGLRRMGFTKEEVTGHGFRAMARTMLHEILNYPPDAIEAQLAHAVPDRLGRAYNRTQHIVVRREMMQAWADYLDGLKAGRR